MAAPRSGDDVPSASSRTRKVADLRSDTVTRPGPAMLNAMVAAPVGDDVWGDDPTVNQLQSHAASMFGHEAALFCPSGTMTNQIAIKVHTQPGDELVCADNAHIYLYEGSAGLRRKLPWLSVSSFSRFAALADCAVCFDVRRANMQRMRALHMAHSAQHVCAATDHAGGGIAFNSGVQAKLLPSDRGRISADQVAQSINADDPHFPTTRLVCLENTCNKGGGSFYSLQSMQEIAVLCKAKGLKLHLDGARIFNAFAEAGYGPADVGPLFDSISVCLSKGLGCPVGSLLIGPAAFIQRARRIRKVLGGGMRQAGFLAAAGLYALEHNVTRLSEDHARARRLGKALSALPGAVSVAPVDTNIVIFTLAEGRDPKAVVDALAADGVLISTMAARVLRLVTHLDVTDEGIDLVCAALERHLS